MAELSMIDDINAVLEKAVETKLEEAMKLRNEYNTRSLETCKYEHLDSKLISIKEVETSLTNELSSLHDTKVTLRSDIDATWELVTKNREKVFGLKSEQLESQELRLKEVELFGRQISEGIPKFRNALRIYSEDYLTEEIQEIRNENRYVRNEIGNIDRKIDNLEEIETTLIPRKETAITELQELNAIWMNSNLDIISVRKLTEYSMRELEAKVDINKRKLARLV